MNTILFLHNTIIHRTYPLNKSVVLGVKVEF